MPVLLSRPPLRPLGRRLRRLRRPVPYWVAAVALAIVTGAVVARLVGDAQAASARYGRQRTTLVAVVDVPAGTVIGPGDTELRDLPVALVPEGALHRAADGSVAAAAMHAGEVVLADRLAPAGRSPTAALLPPGTRGVAIPVGPGSLQPVPGDVVDVLATFDPSLTGDGGDPTVVVASDALVVAAREDAVTVAVDTEVAPRLAFALTAGAVTLVLSGGP